MHASTAAVALHWSHYSYSGLISFTQWKRLISYCWIKYTISHSLLFVSERILRGHYFHSSSLSAAHGTRVEATQINPASKAGNLMAIEVSMDKSFNMVNGFDLHCVISFKVSLGE